MSTKNSGVFGGVILIVVLMCVGGGLIGGLMWGIPKYRIYKQDLRGQATLREATWTKKVRVEDALAEKESATLLADAEVERAKGVARAQKIIDGTLTERYLHYLWVKGLQDGNSEVIYVATEAGIPVTEAGKRVLPQRKQLKK